MEMPANEKAVDLRETRKPQTGVPLLVSISLVGTACALLGVGIIYFQSSAPLAADLREATETIKAQGVLNQTQLREQQARLDKLAKQVSEMDEKLFKLRQALDAVDQKTENVAQTPSARGLSTRNVLKLNIQDEPPSLSDVRRATDNSLQELKVVPSEPGAVDKVKGIEGSLELPKISVNPNGNEKR